MKSKIVSGIMSILLVLSVFTLLSYIQPVRAQGTIYINADGSISPSTAPISTVDNVTYTFTDDIIDSIVIERDNIVVDGAGYTLQGPGNYVGTGIDLTGRSNVTIKNMEITGFLWGIYLDYSDNNSVSGNNIANDWAGIMFYSSCNNNSVSENKLTANGQAGIWLYSSSNNNTFSGNNMANNAYGITLAYSNNNIMSGNNIANNFGGIYLYASSINSVSENNMANNGYGIVFWSSSNNNSVSGNNITANYYGGIYFGDSSSNNNTFYHDNFIGNNGQVYSSGSINVWDDGYPSGGNYWSGYSGNDIYSGPYQNETGSDGIGDSPYTIDANNLDNYPLMYPYSTNSLFITISPSSVTLHFGQPQTFNSTVSGGTLPYSYQWCLNGTAVPSADFSSWTFTSTSVGSYTIYANVTDSVGVQATSNIVTVTVGFDDVAVTNVGSPMTVVGQGYSPNINVTIANQGAYTETFNVTAYANTTPIGAQEVTALPSGNSTQLVFTWNTTGFAYGNYTLSATADTVPGETNISNNNFTCPVPVHVGVPGDVSSTIPGVYDGVVNIKDIAYMVYLFNTRPSSPNWDPNADVNNDGVVNMRDIAICVAYFNQRE